MYVRYTHIHTQIHMSITFKPATEQDPKLNRDQIENLIGASTLSDILSDLVSSSQHIVDSVYSETSPETNEDYDCCKPVKFLSSGDPTSDNCVMWVHDPSSKEAYSVNVTYTFTKFLVE